MSATSRTDLPLIAFTSGEPAGIGPQAALGAARSTRLAKRCRPVLIGERRVWLRAGWRPGLLPLIDTRLGITPPRYGRLSLEGGAASFEAFRLAVELAAKGVIAGVVTAPIAKGGWRLAGIPHADHTEFLERAVGRRVEMLLGLPAQKVWCVTVTRHRPLKKVSEGLSVKGVASAAGSLSEALRPLLGRRPRLGLCGLNPHGGEEGLFGSEERSLLAPAVQRARRVGIDLSGPIPADTAWRLHLEGTYDGLVALYHDQALIPLKAVGGLNGVNWTVGLPFVRTSPAHGTGFDIAGRRQPSFGATLAAAELACGLLRP